MELKFSHNDSTKIIDTLIDHVILFEGQTFQNIYPVRCIFKFSVDYELDQEIKHLIDIMMNKESIDPVEFELNVLTEEGFELLKFEAIPIFYRTVGVRHCEIEMQFN